MSVIDGLMARMSALEEKFAARFEDEDKPKQDVQAVEPAPAPEPAPVDATVDKPAGARGKASVKTADTPTAPDPEQQ